MTRRPHLALALLALLGGCAVKPNGALTQCGGALGAPMLVFELYFGRSVPARADVTDAEWSDFVNQVVTPTLPNGFTVFDADGAWMNPVTRRTIHEHTKVLLAAMPNDPQSVAAMGRIRTAYQLQFHQQLVGMTVEAACGSF